MESGTVELYFYDELDAAERAAMTQHLASCRECRLGLDELETIRTALSTRPVVAAPPGDDWSGFMAKLQSAIASTPSAAADGGVNGQQ
jgi:anti-sigma factor RsiW